MAVGFGSLWVINYKPSALHRVDPNKDTVLATIPLGNDACLGIVVSPVSIWVPSCQTGELNEIDPTTNQVRHRYPVGIGTDREGAFAYAAGSLWLSSNRPDTTRSVILRIDPATGRTVARITVRAKSDVVVAGFGSVWVASSATDSVFRLDPGDNAIVARIGVGPSPKFMAVDRFALWVQNRRDGTVSRVDPRTNREVVRVETGAPTEWGDIAVGAGAVWLSVNGKPVTRIDPRTNHVTHQHVGGNGADAIRVGFGSLWVADHRDGEIWRIPVDQLPH
jgi:streptogramin lyase